MATYFHGGPEIQANTNPSNHLQTLYLMNPNYFSYSDNTSHNTTASNNTPHNNNNNNNNNPHNMFFINHSGGPNALLHHAPPPQQQLIGIPLAGTHTDNNHGRPSSSSTSEIPSCLQGLGVPSRVHYNLWGPTMDPSPAQHGPIQTGTQGLSLSLSPQKAVGITLGDGDGRMSMTMAATTGGSCVLNGVQGVVLGSKYLKVAQELLDEVVNVGDFNKGESSGVHKTNVKIVNPTSDGFGGGALENGSTVGGKVVEQLTVAQRQELQMKKVKLLTMLDEVEKRYKQYHTQMQMVISFFEQAGGISSAKSYTSIALQTISRQFRCLKDTITSQIKSTSKSLGEDDKNDGGSGEGGVGSRLKFVDHQLRQHLGMMQHNDWRTQRGLPERAVSVLRAWLFEHFLHPYPKDSDKHMLAKQTGLTRSQVSNWFINARVRLWKPMVEEMYAEEVKTQEHLNNVTTTNPETTNTSINDQNKTNSCSKQPTITHHQQDPISASIIHHTDHQSTNDTSSQGFSLIGSSSDMESLMGRSPKKQRSGSEIQQNSPSSILSMDMEMKLLDHQHQTNKYTQDHQRQAHIINNGPGFNPYLVQEMGRFDPNPLATHHYSGNGVSLTLGLPHCENLSLGNQQDFISQGMNLGRRLDIGANEGEFCGINMGQQPSHPSNNGHDSIDIQNRTRFAAQLLHDFVA